MPPVADPSPTPADLLAHWPAEGRPAARLAALSRAVWGDDVRRDGAGRRNQRALALHRALVGRPPEARVTCPDCGTENEAVLPVAAVLGAPAPEAGTPVRVELDGGPADLPLPRAGDAAALDPAALVAGLLGRAAGAGELARIAEAWEAADPAGAIELGLECSGCGRALSALADPAAFLARDLDIRLDRLLREIDLIARTYGWSEPQILALPEARRRRYVALITARAAPALEGRRA